MLMGDVEYCEMVYSRTTTLYSVSVCGITQLGILPEKSWRIEK